MGGNRIDLRNLGGKSTGLSERLDVVCKRDGKRKGEGDGNHKLSEILLDFDL